MKLNILYILSKSKLNKNGKCPIKCRLTYNKKRHHFATGLYMKPSNWNSNQQLVEPSEPDENYINRQLRLIRQNLNRVFLFLQVRGTAFTFLDIYTQYKGEAPKDELGIIGPSNRSINY